jgi:hypothetical protein
MKNKKMLDNDDLRSCKPNATSRISICSNNTSGSKTLRHGSAHHRTSDEGAGQSTERTASQKIKVLVRDSGIIFEVHSPKLRKNT